MQSSQLPIQLDESVLTMDIASYMVKTSDNPFLPLANHDGRKRRILMISHVSFLGGAERSLLELATALHAGDYCEPYLACPPGPLRDAATHGGIPVFPLPKLSLSRKCLTLSFLWQFVQTQAVLFRHLQEIAPDIVHANGLRSLLLCLPLARIFRKPCIWHVRDNPASSRIADHLVGRVDAAITASQFVANRFDPKRPCSLANVHVIPNGVEDPAPPPESVLRAHAELRSSPDVRIVMMVAQAVPWKRHDLFLEAAARLSAEDTTLHFVLVGSNPWLKDKDYMQALEDRADQPDLRGRVTFLGQRDDAAALIAASDVLVLPSDNEPFGRVVVEAWWLNTPVVVANCGAPAAMVDAGTNGMHFEQGNAEELAKVLQMVLRDGNLARRLAGEGRPSAKAYLPLRQAQAITALYQKLLASRPGPVVRNVL